MIVSHCSCLQLVLVGPASTPSTVLVELHQFRCVGGIEPFCSGESVPMLISRMSERLQDQR
jgi:hypothetical protein